MPGLPFPCLNTIQPVFGCDVHLSIPPPVPAPAPHVVVWTVGASQSINFLGAASSTSKASSPESGCARPVQSGWGYNVGRTHDSGPHPAHIWPNALLPLIMVGSACKHEFGSGTVKVPGGHDAAIGLLWVADLGLDCADPLPLPASLSITATNTVRAGFTWSDYLRGLVQVYVDVVVTFIISRILGGLGGVVSRLANRALAAAVARAVAPGSLLARRSPGFFARSGRELVAACRASRAADVPSESPAENPGDIASTLAQPIMGLFAGGPMGTSHGGGLYGNTAGGPVDTVINDLFRE